jgi:hypothetical protein
MIKMGYDCKKCGWNPLDIQGDDPPKFYYVEHNKAVAIEESWIPNEDNGYSINVELIKKLGKQVYPIHKHHHPVTDYWSGANGFSWIEVHFCPNCNEEFEFQNSTI